MEIIEPSVKLEAITQLIENNSIQSGLNVEKVIEKAGRTCYKSEDKITDDSAEKFCEMIQTRNHMSVLEHASATFRIICDRGVSHEIVRHRIVAYSQESTRYVTYTKDKKGMQFIKPNWVSMEDIHNSIGYIKTHSLSIDRSEKLLAVDAFVYSCMNSEELYNRLVSYAWKPQQARAVLPNCLKTEIVMTANFREWLHFLELRTSPQAHPDMQVIAKMIGNKLHEVCPTIFKKEY